MTNYKMLKLKEVMKMVRISNYILHKMEKAGEFPCRIQVGQKLQVWRSDEVEKWMKENAVKQGEKQIDSKDERQVDKDKKQDIIKATPYGLDDIFMKMESRIVSRIEFGVESRVELRLESRMKNIESILAELLKDLRG